MAERSEAIVLRKSGGRQNVVLLRTLKRTRLAKRVHNIVGIFLDNLSLKQKKRSPRNSHTNGLPHPSEVMTYSRAVVAFQHFL